MIRRLFGETEQEQLEFLHPRAIATIIILVLVIVALILNLVGFSDGAGKVIRMAEMGFAIIMLFVWGWPVVKRLFGITAIAALFSGNIVIGVLFFVLYITLAYFLGIIFAFIGTTRYIYLRIKYGKN